MSASVITEPGAYPGIDAEDYHRNANLLPAPSLSSSGAKTIRGRSPFHFWFDSPMNPKRPPEPDKPHFNVGKAAHDLVLLSDRWPEFYHIVPNGFSVAHHNKWAEAIPAYEAARDAGKTILKRAEADTVEAVADAIASCPTATAALTNGERETTLAWRDPETDVWLRARPDFLPKSAMLGAKVSVVADLKFVAPAHASPLGFQRAIANFGYYQSAAFYADGIEAIYGRAPSHWLHVVVEKEPPHCVALYELPAEDIERGRWVNREAIQTFAQCLGSGIWPGYADEPVPVGLPAWAKKSIDENENLAAIAFAAAA